MNFAKAAAEHRLAGLITLRGIPIPGRNSRMLTASIAAEN